MINKEYQEELLEEKVNSMKQLDRIEFKQNASMHENKCNDLYINYVLHSIISYILLCTSIIILELNSEIFGIILVFLGFLMFILSSAFLVSYLINRSKSKKQNEEFIKEHTN